MFKLLKKRFLTAMKSRSTVLGIVFVILAFVLVQRLFQLQIIRGEDYLNNFTMTIRREVTLASTRGDIYDSEGKALAYNQLAYAVIFEDNNTYDTMREQNLSLNSSMYGLLQLLEENGDEIDTDFAIALDEEGKYSFSRSGFSLLRFKADIYGESYTDDLTAAQSTATPEKMMEDMAGEKMYGIDLSIYDKEELKKYNLPDSFTQEEAYKITIMRSKVAANSYQKYVSTTLAQDISEKTMAIIMENKDIYTGVDVVERSKRIYEDSIYFAPLLGYTGNISAEEMEELNGDGGDYSSNDVVGKSGLEREFETTLQGIKGSQNVYVDNLGTVLSSDSLVEPQAGDDIYLTLDRNLQISAYKILEQYIAGIVWSMMVDAETFNTEYINSTDEIRIPVFDVYYALFENHVLDVDHLSAKDATATEQRVYQEFLSRRESVFQELRGQLITENPTAYQDLPEQMQAYQSYIVNDVLITGTGIINEAAIDKTDATYKAWTEEETISLQEYLTYAISQNWIDVSKIDAENEFMDTDETFQVLSDYLENYLSEDTTFTQTLYKYMIQDGLISGSDVCLLLFDQNIIEMNETDYSMLQDGSLTAFDFIRAKIYNLEITPAQLALEPCSGSVVITDPDNGNVLACVTYPGYDNNRLANEMDTEYYNKLNTDLSTPFYNKATQEATAPGSTFKLVSATAGVQEGVVSIYDTISCLGKFELVDPAINCWIHSDRFGGAHGAENLTSAIKDSCNYYFNTVGYMLGKTGPEEDDYDSAKGVETLAKYASMYGLDQRTGIEVGETAPNVSDTDAARSAMGQGTNSYTTSQLARYVTTLANSGTCYDLTLLQKTTDSDGNVLEEKEPVVHNQLELPSELWNSMHEGMRQVVENSSAFSDFDKTFKVAGKTGTAQESTVHANHALFIGYAPYDSPEISMAVRITNGYSSRNAAAVAKDIFNYYFELKDENEIINGTANTGVADTTQRTD